MPARRFYAPGEWNAICDTCGRRFKSSELRQQWDGPMVCKQCHDYRHPQEFVRGRADDQSIPWSRPRQPDEFVDVFTGSTDRVIDGAMIDKLTLG